MDSGKKKLGKKGFTLIEVIVTLAILGVIVVPLSTYFAQSARYSAEARFKLEGTGIAQKHMEIWKHRMEKANSLLVPTDGLDDRDSRYYVDVDITSVASFDYQTESDSDARIDYEIVHSDNTDGSYPNQIYARKPGGAVSIYFPTAGENSSLDIALTDSSTFLGLIGRKSSSPIPVNSGVIPFTLDAGTNTEYLRVLVNTNASLTLNVSNKLTKADGTKMMIYVEHKKDKTGKVMVNTQDGSVQAIEHLYDSSINQGLDTSRLYKISVKVYLGTNTGGKLVSTLESVVN